MQSIIYFVCVLLIHDHKVLFIYKLENPKHIDNRKTKYNRDKDKLIDKSKLDISKYIVIPPSSWSIQVSNAQLEKKNVELLSSLGLGKYVCKLIFRDNMFRFDSSIDDMITDEMTFSFIMFRSFMKDWISS